MVVLSYLSNSVILHYLPAEKRRELSKKVPSFRGANRKFPYRLKSASIYIHPKYISISLDNCTIEYFCINGRIDKPTAGNLCYMCNFIGYSDNDIVTEDIKMRNELLKKLLKYFLNRPGTSVDCLSIKIFDDNEWCEQNDFNDIQLKIGTLDVVHRESNKHCTMELFKNSHFSEIEFTIYNLEEIDTMKSLNSSREAHFVIRVYDSNEIDLQSLIVKLNDNKMKYTLKLDYNMFYNFLETLKTSRSYPLFTVKSTQIYTEPSESQLKKMGGVKSFVTKECKIQCYTFPTSDPQKEVIVTCDDPDSAISCFKAEVQQSGTSEPCTPNVTS